MNYKLTIPAPSEAPKTTFDDLSPGDVFRSDPSSVYLFMKTNGIAENTTCLNDGESDYTHSGQYVHPVRFELTPLEGRDADS